MATSTEATRLAELAESNEARVAHLAEQGLQIAGRELLVRDVYLEHILRRLGGEQALVECRLDIETRVAAQLRHAEAQLPAARRAQTARLLGVPGAAG